MARTNIRFTNATQELVNKMMGHLRACDQMECEASSGSTAEASLQYGFDASDLKWVMLYGEEPVICFGAAPYPDDPSIGVPWALATNTLENDRAAKLAFARIGKIYVGKMLAKYYHLINFVDARNTKAINWLKWCGFKVDIMSTPYGVSQKPFYKFEKIREAKHV